MDIIKTEIIKDLILRPKNYSKLGETGRLAIKDILNSEHSDEKVFFACYAPEEACKMFNLYYTGEEAQTFANELRFQFSQHFPAYTHPNIRSSAPFTELESKLTNFVALQILEVILSYSYLDMEAIERAGYLLRAKRYTNYESQKAERLNFGGICEIFSKKEYFLKFNDVKAIANWLLPYTDSISKLFDIIMIEKYPNYNPLQNSKQNTVSEKECIYETPQFDNACEKECIHETPQLNNDCEKDSEKKVLLTKKIIDNQELIEDYFHIINQLKTLCLSPAMLEEREHSIKTLFEISKELTL